MRRRTYWTCWSVLLLAAFILPLTSGCEGRVRIYDEYHHDYHHWDAREDRAYRLYFSDRGIEYREYSRLRPDEQRAYWNWRHDHPDAGRH
jgi:hypothetical protein